MRRLLALLLLIAVIPGTLLRDAPGPRARSTRLVVTPLPLPKGAPPRVGPFDLVGAWRLDSGHALFGGYSALVLDGPGRLLAVSDSAAYLRFAMPGRAEGARPRYGMLRFAGRGRAKETADCEALARDPASGALWCAFEFRNAIVRFSPALVEQRQAAPAGMRNWPANSGAEAMARLADGRFVALGEAFSSQLDWRRHPALVFAGDPAGGAAGRPFTFAGPTGYSPTDMAQLPDGRVLVVMRRLIWPFPTRFAVKLALADPAEIRPGGTWIAREVASLDSPVPVDNYEGLAIEVGEPGKDGEPAPVTAWIIADANGAALQRTLLLELRLVPERLPPLSAKARNAGKAKGARKSERPSL